MGITASLRAMSSVDAMSLVDLERLIEFVARVAPLAGEVDVQLLSGGQSNLTYLLTSGDYEYVARRRPIGEVPAGAHDMKREYRVLAALMGTTLPVPRVHGFCDDDRPLGAPFYVMDRVRGSVLHRADDVAHLTEQEARDISIEAIDVLTSLHQLDYVAIGLADLGRPEGFVARRVDRWLQQWDRALHRDHPLVAPLATSLAGRAHLLRGGSALVHGDYRLGNMIVDPGPPGRVAALLDWELSTLGDPLTDLAHLLVYWESSRGRLTHESQLIALHPGFLSGAQLAERYAETTGSNIAELDLYLAFEHWRAAIIKEGIYMRRRSVGDGTPGTDELGESVQLHLEEAADLLR